MLLLAVETVVLSLVRPAISAEAASRALDDIRTVRPDDLRLLLHVVLLLLSALPLVTLAAAVEEAAEVSVILFLAAAATSTRRIYIYLWFLSAV